MPWGNTTIGVNGDRSGRSGETTPTRPYTPAAVRTFKLPSQLTERWIVIGACELDCVEEILVRAVESNREREVCPKQHRAEPVFEIVAIAQPGEVALSAPRDIQ
jgi:hypothetical protein